ncbi:uncharacterized protein ATC70_003455 [Mucor velutinosus]|uniref:Thioesterase domain-containing protein n=1 Tax=Mucor velutinosus TaxID=708070 RepID=A0AAN7HLD1_9FUNG|nr:hypothetical protein ATC70_003455 [Mucor velutinosus]
MKITQEAANAYPRLQEMVDYYNKKADGPTFWEHSVEQYLSITAAKPDVLSWEFTVEELHCNQLGNLHGGCVATLIDICSSFAVLVSTGKQWSLIGVSTDLSVAYLSGVSEGDVIRLECEVQRVGKTLANIFTRVYDQNNRLCYSGSHTKYNIDARL